MEMIIRATSLMGVLMDLTREVESPDDLELKYRRGTIQLVVVDRVHQALIETCGPPEAIEELSASVGLINEAFGGGLHSELDWLLEMGIVEEYGIDLSKGAYPVKLGPYITGLVEIKEDTVLELGDETTIEIYGMSDPGGNPMQATVRWNSEYEILEVAKFLEPGSLDRISASRAYIDLELTDHREIGRTRRGGKG